MNRWLVVFAAILVFGGAWLWWTQPPLDNTAAEALSGAGVGRQAPDFTLTTLDGTAFTLSEERGKPVVLNFWATWCIPCQRELPAVQQAHEHYGEDIVFAAVDQGETVETVQRYADELGLTFTIPMDGQQDAAELYNIKGLPTTFFIDAEGIVRSVWMGEMNSVTLAEHIAKIQ